MCSCWRRQRRERESERRKRPGRWRGKKQRLKTCWSRPHHRWSQRPLGSLWVLSILIGSSVILNVFLQAGSSWHLGGLIAGKGSIFKRICLWRHNPGGREEEDIQGLHACLRGESVVRWSMFGWCEEDDFNMLCLCYSARMPASPFQDKETLKEVQKAPQETLPLPIGWWFRRKMAQTGSCCSRAWSVLFCVDRAQSQRTRTITKRKRDLSPSLLRNAPPVENLVSGLHGSDQRFDQRLQPLLILPERSYKKSKKHKKKTKKRRHKSVSTQEMLRNADVFGFVLTEPTTTRRLLTLTTRRKEESVTGSARRT